jgi:hypothetical protein
MSETKESILVVEAQAASLCLSCRHLSTPAVCLGCRHFRQDEKQNCQYWDKTVKLYIGDGPYCPECDGPAIGDSEEPGDDFWGDGW